MFKTGLEALVEKTSGAAERAIKRFYTSGNVAAANRIARTPGVLKPAIPGTPASMGSQLAHLGSGMEGTSTLVAHPTHGVSVRKVYDPKGVSGPQMVANKRDAGLALSGNPDVAQFLGEASTRIGPAHFYEHVKGSPGFAAGSKPQDVVNRVADSGKRMGVQLNDLHPGNVVGGKVVDYFPTLKGRDLGFNWNAVDLADDAQAALDVGKPHPYTNYLRDPRRPGNLMARAAKGAPPLIPGSSPPVLK